MVRFSKKLALSSAAAVLLAGGGWMWLQEASAAISALPQGTIFTCNGNRDHEIAVNGGPSLNAATLGAIKAEVGKTTTTSDGRQTTSLKVVDTFTHGRVEGLGDLVITLDSSRPSPASSLTANRSGSAYPATQTMRFFATFVLNGEAFNSSDPVQVVNSNVTSFPPAPGTVYVLTNAMTLTSAQGNTLSLKPGRAFTIN